MYKQLLESVKKFQTENIKECLHTFDTQKNEAVNNLIARVAPKFKHFGTTPALDTRVSTVAGTTNMGYENYYLQLILLLLNSDSITGSVIESGIKRIDKIKTNNRKRKSTKKHKRDRTHGKESKSKREVFEARIDKEHNIGTYKGSIAMCDSDDEKEYQGRTNDKNDTQQLSNFDYDKHNQHTNKSTDSKEQIKTKKRKFCKWCNTETDHTTWRSVRCVAHDEYLKQKVTKHTNTRNVTHRKKK